MKVNRLKLKRNRCVEEEKGHDLQIAKSHFHEPDTLDRPAPQSTFSGDQKKKEINRGAGCDMLEDYQEHGGEISCFVRAGLDTAPSMDATLKKVDDCTSEENPSPSPEADEPSNPFASFSFGGGSSAENSVVQPPKMDTSGRFLHIGSTRQSNLLLALSGGKGKHAAGSPKRKRDDISGHGKEGRVQHAAGPSKKGKHKPTGSRAVDYGSLSEADRLAAVRKWRAMADVGQTDAVQRFQVLVAVILSSRAQAGVVSEALSRLKSGEGGLTPATMAAISQDELAHTLRRVHWNKAKAKHIRDTATAVKEIHRGEVPHGEKDLLQLPGVGPALGRVLSVVYASWKSANPRSQPPQEEGEDEGPADGSGDRGRDYPDLHAGGENPRGCGQRGSADGPDNRGGDLEQVDDEGRGCDGGASDPRAEFGCFPFPGNRLGGDGGGQEKGCGASHDGKEGSGLGHTFGLGGVGRTAD
ncbi:unnamed protein product [Discosporangium mesarthrocarpum]